MKKIVLIISYSRKLINRINKTINVIKRFILDYTLFGTRAHFLKKIHITKTNLPLSLVLKEHYDYTQILRKRESQFLQDIFVLLQLDFKREGFFVEFGASDGKKISNTYLLEKNFGWKGIIAEPARCWHEKLKKNRSCFIEKRCVWSESGKILEFTELASLSTITEFEDSDMYKDIRKKGKKYHVETISLNDLLRKFKAPKSIDYLSIDTEGSEYSILKNFDFEEYDIKVITCEHNYTKQRDAIMALLEKKNYKRVFSDLSEVDDWYVKSYLV